MNKKTVFCNLFCRLAYMAAILLFCSLPASASSQNPVLLSLDYEDTPLTEVLDAIKGQSAYLFINKGVDVSRHVDINVEKKSIEYVCDLLFTPINVRFTIEGSSIIIENKPEPSEISGTVTDAEGLPVPGAAVLVKGTSKGTTTDLDGKFVISATPDQILEFSCIGYQNSEAAVGNRAFLNVTLKEDSVLLESVVVIGYGVVNARDQATKTVWP